MDHQQANKARHSIELPADREVLNATEGDFSNAEAQARLREYGFHKLPEQPPATRWQILLRQFHIPLIDILLLAGVVSLTLGETKDAGFIGAVQLINALMVATGMPLPLLPVQILWLNLVTNGIQNVALAFESGEEDILRRKPRPPPERIFNRLERSA